MIRMTYLDAAKPLTEEEIRELEDVSHRPIVFDEACHEMAWAQLMEFRRVQ